MRKSRGIRVLAVAALILTASVGVTGCSLISDAISGASGGTVNLGGDSIPEGFPAEVVLAAGDVANGSSVGSDAASRVYNVTISSTAADAGAARAEAVAALEAAGFETSDLVEGAAADASTAAYANGTWGVLVVAGGEAGGEIILNYTVTPISQ
jgi:hypothetical protein